MTVHDFTDQLTYSHAQANQPWWETVYRKAFPRLATMACVRDDGWAQRGGIDRVVVLDTGKCFSIDEKVRKTDYGDILLELWSNHERKDKGWALKDLACDYIAYAVVPTETCYLLPVPEMQRATREHMRHWVDMYGWRDAQNAGYMTRSVPGTSPSPHGSHRQRHNDLVEPRWRTVETPSRPALSQGQTGRLRSKEDT